VSRPPISMEEHRYPQQLKVTHALSEWALQQKSLEDAAKKLGCSYRMLSNYRHGQRWIPDDIVERMGFDPNKCRRELAAARNQQKTVYRMRASRRSRIVNAAVDFYDTFQAGSQAERRIECRVRLFTAIANYLEGQ
jgi:hypothetical protein